MHLANTEEPALGKDSSTSIEAVHDLLGTTSSDLRITNADVAVPLCPGQAARDPAPSLAC
ncbi:hypothetical protein [Streptomyces sp. NPDC087437]|uniref:hypothetical protein n=1 Tax=Streptomyces sp. NPDC087437 TaxID=3365789 RepID=UPI00381A3A79